MQVRTIALLATSFALATAQPGMAQTGLAGKSVRLYIGTGPGGGYDTYGRLLARHLGRYLPGTPAVLPVNMPGASSLTLTNFLFNQAPRDGTALGIVNQSMTTEQYLGGPNIYYDVTRFHWIGRVTSAVEMAIVWHTVPVSSIDDVRRRETIMGGTGPTSGTVYGPYLLNNLAGTRFKVITGFQGTSDIALAMERGEIEGSATPLESLTSYRADWVRDKKIKILVQYTARRDPEVANVPTMVELGQSEDARKILAFFANSAEIGRAFLAPPGMQPDAVSMLRRAFLSVLEDADFKEEAKRAGFPIKPMNGEELQKLVSEFCKLPDDLLKKARTARDKQC